jgi:nucleolar protein 56
MVVETINSLEEIEDSTGKLIERLREWCTPYLPEMEKLHNHELYAKIIATETSRENIINSGILDNTHVSLSENYDVEIGENDLEIIKTFANSIYSLYKSKNKLEEFIDEKIKEIAPNMYDVAGANLAAKLIAHTNGLENLAKLPSSTIQIIGAEKAIFRHLKTGENPPKHGLIFQHPSIRGSNWWVRGKLARTVASKITIAARKDAFSNEYDPNLKLELDERIEEIKKSHPFPERKKSKKDENNKKSSKGKKAKKERGKKKKRNKKKLRKGEYTY